MIAELLAEFQFVSTMDEMNQWYLDAHACSDEVDPPAEGRGAA